MPGAVVLDRDHGWRQIRKALVEQLGSTAIDIEVFIPGDPTQEGTVAHYAAINEYGSADGHVPQRSFLRATITERSAAYIEALKRALRRVATTGEAIDPIMQKLGLVMLGDVQRRIAAGIDPPNAPSTIAKKGSSTPLIDTGALRQALVVEVKHRQRGKFRAPRSAAAPQRFAMAAK